MNDQSDLRDEIHNAWARVREDGEVYHADVENTLLVVQNMIEHGALAVPDARA